MDGLTSVNVKRRILELGQKMDENKAYPAGRNLIVAPATKTDILELDLFNAANTIGDDGTALRTASLGDILGFDVMMAQNTPSLLAATIPAIQADELASDAAVGALTITVDSGAGFVVGDYITLQGDLVPFRVTGIAGAVLTLNRPIRVAVLATASDIQQTSTGLVDLAGHSGVSTYPIGYDKDIKVDGTGVPRQGSVSREASH